MEKKKKRPRGRPVTHPKLIHVESGKVFETYKAAAEFIGGHISDVYRVTIGTQSHHKGQHFKFIK